MAFLPERYRSHPPQVWNRGETQHGRLAHPDVMQWRPVRRGSSLTPILLTVTAAAVVGFMVRASIDKPHLPRLVTVERPAYVPPASPPASGPCGGPDGTVRNGPHVGGFAPRDVFGFLPSCQGGR